MSRSCRVCQGWACRQTVGRPKEVEACDLRTAWWQLMNGCELIWTAVSVSGGMMREATTALASDRRSGHGLAGGAAVVVIVVVKLSKTGT
jgi:hypothetical protein